MDHVEQTRGPTRAGGAARFGRLGATLVFVLYLLPFAIGCGGGGGEFQPPPPPERRLSFSVQPGDGSVDVPIPVEVSTVDGGGGLIPVDGIAVSLDAAGTTDGLVGTLASTTVAGVATFPDVRVLTAGTDHRLRATAAAHVAAISDAFSVSAGPATRLQVAGEPDPVVTGFRARATVTAWDEYGNVATGYRGTVRFSSSDAAAVLPGDHTFTAGDRGRYEAQVTLATLGTQSVDATDVADATIAGSGSVTVVRKPVINELFYDEDGFDGETVFVELYGAGGTILDGHRLVCVNGANGTVYRTIPLAGTIPADGFYVIATSTAVAGLAQIADLVDDGADLQNGPDEVRLYVDYGEAGEMLLDALAYGSSAFTVGEGAAAPDVSPGNSLGRVPDGADSDDNLADFAVHATPTPGTAN